MTNKQLARLEDCTSLDYLCCFDCDDCDQSTWSKIKALTSITSTTDEGESILLNSCPGITSLSNLKTLSGNMTGAFVSVAMDGLRSFDGLQNVEGWGKNNDKAKIVLHMNEGLTSALALGPSTEGVVAADLVVTGQTALTCTPDHWPQTDAHDEQIQHGACPVGEAEAERDEL